MNVSWKTVPVTDDLVATASYRGTCPVLVKLWWRSNERHLVAKKDDGGWYVRTGKRGQVKEYLGATAMVTVIDGNPTLYTFKTEKLK